jgi:geranylgeranyl pyrophosphate synthase
MIQQVVTDRRVTPEDWQTIKGLLATHGAVDTAYERAVAFAKGARAHLMAAFPPSVERDGLASLADYVLQRDR